MKVKLFQLNANSIHFLLSVLIICGISFSNDQSRDISHLTILQTSDIHNHASGYGPFLDYTPLDTSDGEMNNGGYARLATLIGQIRAEQEAADIPVMLFDSGDFLMGTVYDMTVSDPITFKYFQLMGYDAITLGNHEFDWSPAGLAMHLLGAMSSDGGFSVPIVATNTVTDDVDPADDDLEAFFNMGMIQSNLVIDLPNGIRVGLLGLMGPSADSVAPTAPPVTFNHDYVYLQEQVDYLRNDEDVDLVVVLSHSGVNSDGNGDDNDLALNVSGIDVIASGHYHTATEDEFIVGGSNTIIFSPGEYGEWLSRLDLSYDIETGEITDFTFELIPVDDTIEGNPLIQGMVDQYHAALNADLQAGLGLELTSPISITDFPLELTPLQETGLGNLTADASRSVASTLALMTSDPTPYAMAVVPSGVIRDNLYPGNTGLITFTDIYNALPLGISPDVEQPLPGYPMMSIYTTAPEIRNVCEAGLTLAPMLGSDFYLNYSGIRVDYDPAGAPTFQGVTGVYICGNALPAVYGGDEDVFCTDCETPLDLMDNTTLYRVVVDLYALMMMDIVTDLGLVIVPKNAAGEAIDLSDPMDYMQYRIDADPDTDGVQELKEWMSLLNFLGDIFPADGTGISEFVYGTEGIALGRINYPSDVVVSVTNADVNSVTISMDANVDLYGFQFQIIADDQFNMTLGGVLDSDPWISSWMMESNEAGVILGLSITGDFIPAGTQGVWIEVEWDIDDVEGMIDLDVVNFAGINGTALTYEEGEPYLSNVESSVIDDFHLSDCYPNPFNPVTNINFELPYLTDVQISIYNLQGELITDLINTTRPAGDYTISWNAVNRPSGLYFVKMTTSEFTDIQKVMLIK